MKRRDPAPSLFKNEKPGTKKLTQRMVRPPLREEKRQVRAQHTILLLLWCYGVDRIFDEILNSFDCGGGEGGGETESEFNQPRKVAK